MWLPLVEVLISGSSASTAPQDGQTDPKCGDWGWGGHFVGWRWEVEVGVD